MTTTKQEAPGRFKVYYSGKDAQLHFLPTGTKDHEHTAKTRCLALPRDYATDDPNVAFLQNTVRAIESYDALVAALRRSEQYLILAAHDAHEAKKPNLAAIATRDLEMARAALKLAEGA